MPEPTQEPFFPPRGDLEQDPTNLAPQGPDLQSLVQNLPEPQQAQLLASTLIFVKMARELLGEEGSQLLGPLASAVPQELAEVPLENLMAILQGEQPGQSQAEGGGNQQETAAQKGGGFNVPEAAVRSIGTEKLGKLVEKATAGPKQSLTGEVATQTTPQGSGISPATGQTLMPRPRVPSTAGGRTKDTRSLL